MTNKTLFNCLIVAEVIVVIFAGAVFSIIHPKMLASLFAGTAFILLGLAILAMGLARPELRRTFTFLMGLIHLFVISIPMLGVRITHYGTDFNDLKVLGLPGPLFHQVSTGVYFVMMIATVVDRVRLGKGSTANVPHE